LKHIIVLGYPVFPGLITGVVRFSSESDPKSKAQGGSISCRALSLLLSSSDGLWLHWTLAKEVESSCNQKVPDLYPQYDYIYVSKPIETYSFQTVNEVVGVPLRRISFVGDSLVSELFDALGGNLPTLWLNQTLPPGVKGVFIFPPLVLRVVIH
jgi:hypothetical protein